GATWTASSGATLADQDRPWLATGPGNRVYLLFHNLASGGVEHEMFVSTSTDGGATFAPPVPIAPPGSAAYLDLQCADSGAPSAQTANPYPDFSRASIRYAWSRPDAAHWSAPVTLVPAGPVGHYDPSTVAGDPGELALAYYTGFPRAGADPAWYVQTARVSGA